MSEICESCGASEVTDHWGPGGIHSDLHGAAMCRRCYTDLSDAECASRIRQRRAAAAAKPAGPLGPLEHGQRAPVDADGVPIRAGDWIRFIEDNAKRAFVVAVDGFRVKARVEHPGNAQHGLTIAVHMPVWRRVDHEQPPQTEGVERPAAIKPVEQSAPARSLADFDAAVREHLLPLLPGKLSVVTDNVHTGARSVPFCWVYDDGRVVHEFGGRPFEAEHAEIVASHIARALMARQARGGKP